MLIGLTCLVPCLGINISGQRSNLSLLHIAFRFGLIDPSQKALLLFHPHNDGIQVLTSPPSCCIPVVNHFPLAGSVADWKPRRQPASAKTE